MLTGVYHRYASLPLFKAESQTFSTGSTLRFTGKIKRSEVRAQLYSVRVQGIVSLMLFYLSQLVGLRELLLARSRLGVVPVQE
jgi:hypothetical protein